MAEERANVSADVTMDVPYNTDITRSHETFERDLEDECCSCTGVCNQCAGKFDMGLLYQGGGGGGACPGLAIHTHFPLKMRQIQWKLPTGAPLADGVITPGWAAAAARSSAAGAVGTFY